MATVPNPRTWVVGEALTAAKGNTEWRDALNFLLSPPLFELAHSVSQSIANTTNTPHNFDTEIIDRDSGHSTVSNTSRYTSQTAGYYMLSACCPWNTNGTGKRGLSFAINGSANGNFPSAMQSGSSGYVSPATSGRQYLAVNDYAEIIVYQSSGASLGTNQAADGGVRFGGHWISK